MAGRAAGFGGNFVCQLHRLTIHYSKGAGSSRGVRDYIRSQLVPFAEENPQIIIEAVPRGGLHPYLEASYRTSDLLYIYIDMTMNSSRHTPTPTPTDKHTHTCTHILA